MLEIRPLALQLSCAVVLLAASVSLCLGQLDSLCNDISLDQCDKCINSSPLCSWCPILPQENELLLGMFPEYENVRCRDPSTFPMECSNSTALHGMEQSLMSALERTKNLPLSRSALESPLNQVSPQSVTIRLRQGDTQTFNMSFISLRNTPLDVYFLTDVSASLSTTIRSLRGEIVRIASELEKISTGFAIGFGSFVDKNALPYAHSSYEQYADGFGNRTECRANAECEPTYSFHHSIPLTSDVTEFKNVLPNVSRISSNLDNPEGSLDALLQVALCSEQVGWRDDALKMVFLVTDQTFHVAGDGKLAAIVRPNDGRCNLARIPDNEFEEYEYVKALEQDYVSLWQVRDALLQSRIIPTFALRYDGRFGDPPQAVVEAYQSLREYLSPVPSLVQPLDSRNSETVTEELISIIQTSFNRTVQDVSVNSPTGASGYVFSITPVAGCERTNNETGACLVDFDNTITFSVSVTLENCSKAKDLRLSLRGGPYQFTTIDLEPLCSCPCSEPDQQVIDDSVCTNGRGDQVCGVCECDDPFSGPECQCEVLGTCRSRDDCNGYECDVCGFCVCNGTAFGDNCECDTLHNFCPRRTDPVTGVEQVCAGRGECVCESNTCDCQVAPLSQFKYYGRGTTVADSIDGDCECNPDDCFNPDFPGGLCYNQADSAHNNHLCACDGCNCPPQLFSYKRTCINLETLCDQLDDCVSCFLEEPCLQQPCYVANDCSEFCTNYTFEQLNEDEPVPDDYSFDSCQVEFDGCSVEFYFTVDNSGPVLIAHSADYDCPNTILPWIIAGSAVGLILLAGILALVILKICLVALDRIEYKRFLKEMRGANFAPHDNPLYVTPKIEYQNPIRRVPNAYTASVVKNSVVHRR